jgi:8-oxo-dGTP diphosphatase
VAVVIRDDRFLVIRRSQHVRAPGMHCFPGGGIEPDESPSEAATREMQEELALTSTAIREIWQSTTPWGVELTWWLVEIAPDAIPEPNPLEVECCSWLSIAEIRSLPHLLASNLEFLDAWESGRLYP